MTKQLKKTIWVIALIIIILPIIINIIMILKIIPTSNNLNSGEWLSFWGNFLGGTIGGMAALIAIYFAIKSAEMNIIKGYQLESEKQTKSEAVNTLWDFMEEIENSEGINLYVARKLNSYLRDMKHNTINIDKVYNYNDLLEKLEYKLECYLIDVYLNAGFDNRGDNKTEESNYKPFMSYEFSDEDNSMMYKMIKIILSAPNYKIKTVSAPVYNYFKRKAPGSGHELMGIDILEEYISSEQIEDNRKKAFVNFYEKNLEMQIGEIDDIKTAFSEYILTKKGMLKECEKLIQKSSQAIVNKFFIMVLSSKQNDVEKVKLLQGWRVLILWIRC